ncbi:MAG: hypothetical protein GY841_02845 [FCB group bacterium]|nr:hypothetical protein [FCB group bacterium]
MVNVLIEQLRAKTNLLDSLRESVGLQEEKSDIAMYREAISMLEDYAMLRQHFIFLKEEYMLEGDVNMTESAQALKQGLLTIEKAKCFDRLKELMRPAVVDTKDGPTLVQCQLPEENCQEIASIVKGRPKGDV